MLLNSVLNFVWRLPCAFSGFADCDNVLVGSGFIIFNGFCWEPLLACGAGFPLCFSGFVFWSAWCVDLTARETWVTGFWWLAVRWMRWGPFDTPRTRCCWVGTTTAICDCCDTGTRFGPWLFDCSFKEKADTQLKLPCAFKFFFFFFFIMYLLVISLYWHLLILIRAILFITFTSGLWIFVSFVSLSLAAESIF